MTREQAELDVLHMTAETRAAHSSVVTSAVMLLVTTLLLVVVLVAAFAGALSIKGIFGTFIFLCGLISASNLLLTLLAWGRLNRALKAKTKDKHALPRNDMPTLAANEPLALSHQQSWSSVTEGTTELLSQEPARAMPLKRKAHDTDSIN